MPARVKTDLGMARCAKCFQEIRVTKSNSDIIAHARYGTGEEGYLARHSNHLYCIVLYDIMNKYLIYPLNPLNPRTPFLDFVDPPNLT